MSINIGSMVEEKGQHFYWHPEQVQKSERDLEKNKIQEKVEGATKMLRKCTVINLFGGPSAGKSTLAAGVFYNLKCMGINCELITEYPKDKVWE